MKISYLLVFAAIGMAFATGCSKKDDSTSTTPGGNNGGGTNNGTSKFTATVGGTAYSASTVWCLVNGKALNIYGAASGKHQLGMMCEFKVGTHTIPGTDGNSGYYDGDSTSYTNDNTYGATDGSITISEIDTINHTMTGTFSFNSKNGNGGTQKVENGVFTKVSYAKVNASEAHNYLTYTIDGTTMNPFSFQATPSGGSTSLIVSTYPELSIYFPTNAAVGSSHTWDNSSYRLLYYLSNSSSDKYVADSDGNITITQNDSKGIAGTFQGTVKQITNNSVTKTVATGSFSFQY